MREFEERGEQMGQRSIVKDAFRFAEELGIELNREIKIHVYRKRQTSDSS